MYTLTPLKSLYGLLFLLLIPLSAVGKPAARSVGQQNPDSTMRFIFRPGNDTLYLQGNEQEFHRLYRFVDAHRAAITTGEAPIHVDGYCTSAPGEKENYRLAFIRSNRVKSELITHKGLLERHFVTQNHTTAYQGNKDVVIVTIRIPIPAGEEQAQTVVFPDEKEEIPPTDTHATIQPANPPQPEPEPEPKTPNTNKFNIDLRTNLLYDALLLPTIGVEMRIGDRLGIRLDGSYSHWGGEHGSTQKIWAVSPQVHWYMGDARRFYLGLGANIGEGNVYKYPMGSIISALGTSHTGYQGDFIGGGIVGGYRLPLSRALALDFTLGLGYTRFSYDTFKMEDGVRVYKERDRTRNFWGPTQAGVSLVWKIGK